MGTSVVELLFGERRVGARVVALGIEVAHRLDPAALPPPSGEQADSVLVETALAQTEGSADLELGQSVALKFLPEQLAADTTALDRIRREVAGARRKLVGAGR